MKTELRPILIIQLNSHIPDRAASFMIFNNNKKYDRDAYAGLSCFVLNSSSLLRNMLLGTNRCFLYIILCTFACGALGAVVKLLAEVAITDGDLVGSSSAALKLLRKLKIYVLGPA